MEGDYGGRLVLSCLVLCAVLTASYFFRRSSYLDTSSLVRRAVAPLYIGDYGGVTMEGDYGGATMEGRLWRADYGGRLWKATMEGRLWRGDYGGQLWRGDYEGVTMEVLDYGGA